MGDAGHPVRAAALPQRLAILPQREFVGRAAEQRAFDDLLSTVVAHGGPAGVLLGGDAGAGKTTLAAAAARSAAAGGCEVLYGRGEDGIETPFGVWRQALRSSWPGRERDREALFDAVSDHLEAATERAPILLVLDDLQWADRASLLLVSHVVATQPAHALGFVLSFRTTEAAPGSPLGALLATLAREPAMTRIELEGLSVDDVEELFATDRSGPLDAQGRADARRIWADTRGNPFFVTARLDELQSAGTCSSLPDVIGHRVARLGPGAVDVLSAAAVIGETFTPDIVAAVAGTDEAVAVAVFDHAAADGLVTEVPGDGLCFVHALVADTLAGGLSPPGRRQLHRAAAAELAARHADSSVVAHHLVAADPRDPAGRTAAFDAAVDAGRVAMTSFAYEDAVMHLSRAVEMAGRWGIDDDRRCTALLSLTLAQARSGDSDEACRTYVPALDLAVRLQRWDDIEAALHSFPRTAHPAPDPALVASLQQAADVAPSSTPIRPLVLATLSWVLRYSEEHRRLRALAEQAVVLADEHGDRATRAQARSLLLPCLGGDPDLRAQLQLVSTIDELMPAERALSRRAVYELGLRRVNTLLRMGRLEDVDTELRNLQRRAPTRGRDSLRWWLLNVRAVRVLLAGRLAEAEELGAAADEIVPHGEYARQSARLARLTTVAYLRGGLSDFCDPLASFVSEFPLPAVRSTLVNALAYAGRHTEARAILAELADDDLAAVPRDDSWTSAAFMLADAIRQLDARDEAEALYGALAPHAGEYVVTSAASAACFGPVDRSLGQLALVCGWHDRAERHLADAVSSCARTGARPFLALARLEQAFLGVPGAGDEARAIASDLGLDLVFQRLDALPGRMRPDGAALVQDGDVWAVTYAGRRVRVKDVRGLHYLRELLARPGREMASIELQGGFVESGTPMLDEQAKAAYRRRLEEIDDELDEAERRGDGERAALAVAEREAVAHELARSLGLGGRVRTASSPSERARLNVTRALRSAIDRIEAAHPELGAHLRLTVRTGTYCAYEPDPALSITWSLS